MKTSDFYYDLPKELIAQTPVYPRDASRLLYYDKTADKYQDLHFYDIYDILQPGDLLVVNNTRVINARLHAYDEKARKYEVFLLKRRSLKEWEVLLKPARKAKINSVLTVNSELSLRGNTRRRSKISRIRFRRSVRGYFIESGRSSSSAVYHRKTRR